MSGVDGEPSNLPPEPNWDDFPEPPEPPEPPEDLVAYWEQLDSFRDSPDLDLSEEWGGPSERATETDAASQDVDVKSDAEDREGYQKQLRAAHISQLNTDREMQQKFFKFAAAIIGAPVVTASAGFTWMVVAGDMTETIAAAFFASVVAEVIGLSFVLGKYLFPDGGKRSAEPDK